MAVNAKLIIGINLICVVLLLAVIAVNHQLQRHIADTNDTMLKTLRLATELRQSSDDLTRFVRTYTVTGNSSYWNYFLDVISIRDGKMPLPIYPHRIYWDLYVTGGQPRPSGPPSSLDSRMKQAGFTEEELGMVRLAKSRSDALIDLENVAYHAMIGKYRPTDRNVNVNTSGLTAEQLQEFSVSAPPNQTYAMGLVHGLPYHREKAGIMKPIDDFFVLSEVRILGLESSTRNGTIISVLGFVVIAILTGLLIYTSIEHWRSIQQCRDLYSSKVQARKIADSISGFRLGEVEYLNRLENPDELQQAFITIAGNLKLYKPYLPSHLIDGDSDESRVSFAKQSTVSMNSSFGSLNAPPVRQASFSRLALGLEKRPSTIIAVSNSLVDGHISIGEYPGICKKVAQLSNWLFHVSSRTKGNLSMSLSGTFFITYRGKISSALELIHHSISELDNVTVGCCYNKDICGNIGGEHQRGFVILGHSTHTAEVLSLLAARLRVQNLIEEKTADAVPSAVLLYRCKVQIYDQSEHSHLRAYTLLDIAEACQEEWMYGLSRSIDNPVTSVNLRIGTYIETGKREDRDAIPKLVNMDKKVIDLSWVFEVDPLPSQVFFMERAISLHPETAAVIKSDGYRCQGLPRSGPSTLLYS